MSLSVGTRLGPYEILSALGAGGMGEVYKARDTRLDRTVAIKVLPAALADDPQFRERFDREARAISQLTHPHICTLYDVGEHDGTAYLVMELLDGETLADRLKKGALPLDEALKTAIQIADALSAAHSHGIVHRDLKPGNVMLTKAGAKLLDFGLAKASGPAIAGAGLSMLPTTPPNLTAHGTILGTFQYMAPEQLEGLETDARTDIWALGCVLYEMVSGERAFKGSSQASLIGAIMSASPRPLTEVTPLPPSVDRVVQECLAKDPIERFQSAHDVATNLRWLLDAPQVDIGTLPRQKRWQTLTVAALVLALSAAAMIAYLAVRKSAGSATSMIRFAVAAPENGQFASTPALSPTADQTVAVVADGKGAQRLWLIRFDTDDPKPLRDTEGANFPFWSPDGKAVAFFADRKLKRFDLPTGPPLTIADAPSGRGGVWTDDGDIVFAPTALSGLKRVNASGGPIVDVTTLGPHETSHRFPFLLPGGRVGYRADRNDSESGIWVRDRGGNGSATRLLGSDHSAHYAGGFLFFIRDHTTLLAQRFDSVRATLVGDPVVVANDVAFGGVTSAPAFSVSRDGSVAIRRIIPSPTELRRISRDGRTSEILNTRAGTFDAVELSPNGRQLAYHSSRPTGCGCWISPDEPRCLSRPTDRSTSPSGRLTEAGS